MVNKEELKHKFSEGRIPSGADFAHLIEGLWDEANKVQEDWIEPTLLNGWENMGGFYSTTAYYKDSIGRVHIKGLIRRGEVNTPCFMLPEGYRPTQAGSFFTATSDTPAEIEIRPDGSVHMYKIGSKYTNLDGISFRAEQ